MRKVSRRQDIPASLYGDDVRVAKEEIAKHYRLPTQERVQRRLAFNQKIWAADAVRRSLSEVFLSKCAYCETAAGSLQPMDVHHHRPRANAAGFERSAESPDHYGWLAYDWDNLFLACMRCDRSKSNIYPVDGPRAQLRCTWNEAEESERSLLINPCSSDPRKYLRFWMDGTVEGRNEVGRTTIRVLSLDREGLVVARSNKFKECLEALEQGRRNASAFKHFQMAMEEDAEFVGATRILFFDLFTAAASEAGTAKPLFRSLAEDVIQVAIAADEQSWESVLRVARREKQAPQEYGAPPVSDSVAQMWSGVDRPSTAQIRSIRIENFKGVHALNLELPPVDPSAPTNAPCMMLLGENSTGKSSTLQAIALALMNSTMRARIGINVDDYVPREVTGWQLNDTVTPRVMLEFDTGESLTMHIDPLSKQIVADRELPIVLFAFGSRRFFGKDGVRKQSTSQLKSLFDPFAKLQHPGRWLQDLSDNEFYALARAMREILALQERDNIGRDEEGRLFVKAHGRDTPLERLSDGYRSLMAMVLDVMRKMIDVWGNLESARGLVLIDEIETHLHPRWKLRVMTALRHAMPLVQFIVTTHDPLCLRGMRDGEVQVLIRNSEHEIQVLKGLPDVRGLRAEQLLTSDYFGLASTADPEVEDSLHRLALSPRDGGADNVRKFEALQSFRWIGDSPFEQVFNEALKRFSEESNAVQSVDRAQVREDMVVSIVDRLRRLRSERLQ
ncbi:AAA family ATPase [Variovorax sp. GB1P17]|uniref:AAA family ATPase n=1 Tax=Variovorax sp. GB1P17 TaxID=3443740 RepID=UPI003F465A58